MKFNPQLKDALNAIVPDPPPKPAPKPELPVIPFYNPGAKRQTVVGGDLLLQPADRTARLVTSRAPWWARPPEVEAPPVPKPLIPQTAQPIIKKRKDHTMSHVKLAAPAHPAQEGGIKDRDVLNTELAREFIKRSGQAIDAVSELVEKAKDARASLDIMCDYWKKDWVDFMNESDERLKQLRIFRMSFDTETTLLMTNLRDVRQFFLDKDHDQQVARLREFVDLCERLQKLKTSGFLDTVADTLIKLS